MEIGILTVYYANFGSYYQTMCLNNELVKMGHNCEIINATIRGRHIYKFYLGYLGEKYLNHKMTDWIADKNAPFYIYQSLANDLKNINISPSFMNIKKLSDRYDCIVVGSDELWSATNPIIKYIPEYFGHGIKCPHISYAASGITLKNPSHKMETKMAEGIKTFDCLSVRDEKTANWVKKVTGRNCEICIDPVLLNPYFVKTLPEKEYILVYGQYFSDIDIIKIKQYAKKHQLKLKCISWKHDWCDEFICTQNAEDFERYFAESTYCVTSTFHGIIFSVINKKQFSAFHAPYRDLKINALLKTLKLESQLFNNNIHCFDETIDYAPVINHLNNLRKDARAYIKNALSFIDSKTQIKSANGAISEEAI